MKITGYCVGPADQKELAENTPLVYVRDMPALKATIDAGRGADADKVNIIEAEVVISKPYINSRKEVQVDLWKVEQLMGRDFAINLSLENAALITKFSPHWRKVKELNPSITMRAYLNKNLPNLGDLELPPALVFGNPKIVEKLIAEGYDGASFKQEGKVDTNVYFAFDAKQVTVKKSFSY